MLDSLIEAGALLPHTGPELATGTDRDTFTARHFRHPGLPDRTVVRLVAAALAPADDITMGHLGFAAPTRTPAVGVGRRRAIGFPDWALVHDPANAHHALNLVRDLDRIARTALAGPAKAWDALDALGAQLGGSAPHFLPTFYEEAARIFLDAGSLTYATRMFGRAREAERVHGLAVDPARLHAVFLEFAVAGAVSVKMLSEYCRSLTERASPEAYERFAALCVARAREGIRPYPGMPRDLRRLAKAAGVPAADADDAVVRALLATSAVGWADAGFWKSYRTVVVRLAKADAAVRGRLLAFAPHPEEVGDLWLAILAETGATAALTGPADAVPVAARPPGGPAGWLAMMIDHRTYWSEGCRGARLMDLVEAMTDRLRADGIPVRFTHRWADLDALDLLLAHGIPVAEFADTKILNVRHWLDNDHPGARDLAALAASDRFRPELVKRLRTELHREGRLPRELVAKAVTVPGLRVILRDVLAERSASRLFAHYPQLRDGLSESTVDDADTARRLANIDVADVLAGTLRGGLLDELGWPALEAAVADLLAGDTIEPGADAPVTIVGEGWPALVLRRGERLIVVGPDAVLLDHTVRIPPDHHGIPDIRAYYVDGQLLVTWPGRDDKPLGYWTGNPSHVFPVHGLHGWEPDELTRRSACPAAADSTATGRSGRATKQSATTGRSPPTAPLTGPGARNGTRRTWRPATQPPACRRTSRISKPKICGWTARPAHCDRSRPAPGPARSAWPTAATACGRGISRTTAGNWNASTANVSPCHRPTRGRVSWSSSPAARCSPAPGARDT
jgi:hypothetical protein